MPVFLGAAAVLALVLWWAVSDRAPPKSHLPAPADSRLAAGDPPGSPPPSTDRDSPSRDKPSPDSPSRESPPPPRPADSLAAVDGDPESADAEESDDDSPADRPSPEGPFPAVQSPRERELPAAHRANQAARIAAALSDRRARAEQLATLAEQRGDHEEAARQRVVAARLAARAARLQGDADVLRAAPTPESPAQGAGGEAPHEHAGGHGSE